MRSSQAPALRRRFSGDKEDTATIFFQVRSKKRSKKNTRIVVQVYGTWYECMAYGTESGVVRTKRLRLCSGLETPPSTFCAIVAHVAHENKTTTGLPSCVLLLLLLPVYGHIVVQTIIAFEVA